MFGTVVRRPTDEAPREELFPQKKKKKKKKKNHFITLLPNSIFISYVKFTQLYLNFIFCSPKLTLFYCS